MDATVAGGLGATCDYVPGPLLAVRVAGSVSPQVSPVMDLVTGH